MDTVRAIRESGIRHVRTISSSSQSAAAAAAAAANAQLADQQWTLVGDGEAHLLEQLEALYWDGVASELENVIRTLRAWQSPDMEEVMDPDEAGDEIYGYDTFLDNVSKESRDFAVRYGEFSFAIQSVFQD